MYGSDKVAFFLIGGYSILGAITQISDDGVEAVLEDTMALGEQWPTPEPVGLKRWALSQSGFFDDTTDGLHTALNNQQGVSRVLLFGVEGNTIGKTAMGMAGAMLTKYSPMPRRGELTKAEASYAGSGERENNCVILHALTAETADGNTEGADSYDGAAGTSNGGVGYLAVSALTLDGHTNLTVKVRHSADDVTYADLLTFTAATAITAERKTVAGAVNRYLATSWDFTGAGTSPTATFAVAFQRTP